MAKSKKPAAKKPATQKKIKLPKIEEKEDITEKEAEATAEKLAEEQATAEPKQETSDKTTDEKKAKQGQEEGEDGAEKAKVDEPSGESKAAKGSPLLEPALRSIATLKKDAADATEKSHAKRTLASSVLGLLANWSATGSNEADLEELAKAIKSNKDGVFSNNRRLDYLVGSGCPQAVMQDYSLITGIIINVVEGKVDRQQALSALSVSKLSPGRARAICEATAVLIKILAK